MPLVDEALARAREQHARGDLEGAAATLDAVAAQARERVLPPLRQYLDALTVKEHGLVFRYVPAGTFRMGSAEGEPDEGPPHEVTLPGFWMSEAPLSWDDFARVLGWPAPPASITEPQFQPMTTDFEDPEQAWHDHLLHTQIRLQYCENDTVRADRNWHYHDLEDPAARVEDEGRVYTAQEVLGIPERTSTAPHRFDQKPLVAVDWSLAREVGRRLSTTSVTYRLPTEAEWERAARGCFQGAPYPWGETPPDATCADFDRFGEFSLRPSRAHPPNDYRLHAMAGGVWEWCEDHYDAAFYAQSPRESPRCAVGPEVRGRQHVLRGGSWADCADALRVSFRSASEDGSSPNIGFRLVRTPRAPVTMDPEAHMLVETGRSLAWTFTARTVSTAFALPLEETVTRELKVTYEAGRESLFRPVLPALEDPALQQHHPTEYVNLGQEISRDYVLGGLGQGRWVLIELVLRERSNEPAGYLLEMVDVRDASTHPDWLADYRRQKKARR